MFLNQLSFQSNQYYVISNLLLSKNNYYNSSYFPKLQKIKLTFFFKGKKQAINIKNALFLVGFLNFYFNLKKNKKKLRGYCKLLKPLHKFSFLFFLLVCREILNLSKIYTLGPISTFTINNLASFFILFEMKTLRENLSKIFKLRLTFYFSHNAYCFSKQFLNACF